MVQNLFFGILDHSKRYFFQSLSDPSWPGDVFNYYKTFTTVTVYNMKPIQQAKLQKMAKTISFGSLDQSKMHSVVFQKRIKMPKFV